VLGFLLLGIAACATVQASPLPSPNANSAAPTPAVATGAPLVDALFGPTDWEAVASPTSIERAETTLRASTAEAIAHAISVDQPEVSFQVLAEEQRVAAAVELLANQNSEPALPLHVEFLDCLPDLSAATFDAWFAEQLGPILGFDNPHVYPLGGDRFLWMMHDAFVDYPGVATHLKEGTYLNNFAFLQEGRCFSFVHRFDDERIRDFERGEGEIGSARFFWPLGGEVHFGVLWVFWAETIRSASEPPPRADGLARHPVGTWLAGYDPDTFERLFFVPAPNPGVEPQYGFAMQSDATHTYLFGNPNMLNLSRSNGFYVGPHPSIHTFLARVPRGHLYEQPEYRTSDGWSEDPADAVPISTRFWAENTMQPRLIDGRWIAVTKEDGFWGYDVHIDVADEPWGPWHTVQQFEFLPRFGHEIGNSYQPILLPWRDADDGSLTMVISQNGRDWPVAVYNPPWYRPAAVSVEWPQWRRRS
jgi:hypothetical protein